MRETGEGGEAMSSLTRWAPLRELMTLPEMMDRLMDETFPRTAGQFSLLGTPVLDVYQTDEKVVVKASLPGVKPDSINITNAGSALTIRGEVKEEKESQESS
jgi:HSP20 family protein